MTNPTDLGYTGVQLVVHVPGAVKGFPVEWEHLADGNRPQFPSPPKPLGTSTVTENQLDQIARLARGNLSFPRMSVPDYSRYLGPGPGYTIRDSGSVDITVAESTLNLVNLDDERAEQ